jgi:DNA-binding NtrC family response regulator
VGPGNTVPGGVPGGAIRKSQVGTTESMGVSGYSASSAIPKILGSETLPVLHLMVVDDDVPVRHACIEIASRMGFVVAGAADAAGARAILKHQKIDVILLDMKVPGAGGMALLEEVKTLHPDTSVIVMTAFATVSSAVEVMKTGAGDYLTKPFALEELTSILEKTGDRKQFDLESRRLRERLRNQRGAGQLVGRSPEMENLYRILSKVARSTHPVLILGETGTGKELMARAIHFNGPNAERPFVPVDCASLVPSLIESELFGYVKGAFPGANRNKDGILASANGGTVFLDEISELPLELQAKLLRALQDREIRPEGSMEAVPIAARILAASNRNLALMVEQGRFRRDLYFRREDIGLLAMHFIERIQKETGKRYTLSDEALRVLSEFDWPGNVRELENAIERACAMSSGPVVHVGDLPGPLQEFRLHGRLEDRERAKLGAEASQAATDRILSIAVMEKNAILDTVKLLNGDKLMAAKLLGIGKTTLYRKLKEYGHGDGMEAQA